MNRHHFQDSGGKGGGRMGGLERQSCWALYVLRCFTSQEKVYQQNAMLRVEFDSSLALAY